MAIIAKNTGGSDYAIAPAGNFIARCYSMVHIGTTEEVIQGKTKLMDKVRITFELPTETHQFKPDEPETPFSVSKEYTLSLSEKANLRKMLESWRGKAFTEDEAKGFDITAVLGVPCMVNIIHKTSQASQKKYAEISSIAPMPKGVQCPPAFNPVFEFSVNEFSETKFKMLPEFVQNKIKSSAEYKALVNPGHTDVVSSNDGVDSPDDLPF